MGKIGKQEQSYFCVQQCLVGVANHIVNPAQLERYKALNYFLRGYFFQKGDLSDDELQLLKQKIEQLREAEEVSGDMVGRWIEYYY